MDILKRYGRYRLCRVEVESKSCVYPLDENGKDITTASMVEFENDEGCHYAIYENLGDAQFEDWAEYDYFGDDKDKAVEEFKKLISKGK